MTESTKQPGPERWQRWIAGTVGGTGLFLAYQYVASLKRLANTTGGMDSEFSKVAQSEHLSYLIGQNLWVLVGYLLLWLAAVFLVLPVVAVFRKRFPSSRRGSVALPALIVTLAIHGYFVVRLMHARPYFMNDDQFGHWYHRLLELPPESWRPWVNGALFGVLPWVALWVVAIWWLRRFGPRVRGGIVAVVAVLVVAVLFLNRDASPVQKVQIQGKQPPNVIIIASDSLRGDRIGYSGYRPARKDGPAAEGVSPHIDKWAKDAVRFERAYSPIGSTMESSISMFSSTWPHTHGVRHMFPQREQIEATQAKIDTMADVLSERGYDTVAIGDWCANYYNQIPLGFRDISVSSFDNFRIYVSQAVLLAHFVVPVYFDNPVGYKLFPQLGSFAQFVTPEVVTQRVEDKLAKQATTGRPFFWHVFYSCNHLPYRAATKYKQMFTDPAYRGANKDYVAFDINEFVSGTNMEDKLKALSEAEVRQIRGLYDGCTREFDDCFGRIMAALEKEGLADNTIVVMCADHGDDLYEPGVTLTHGLGFNGADHCSHIPLAITGPGISGKSLPEQVRTIDLAPTLLDFLGIEKPASWEGKSLAGWVDGTEQPKDLPFYGETSFPYILFRVPGVERPDISPMDEMTTIDRDYNYHFVLKPEWEQAVITSKQRCLRTRHWKVVATPTKAGDRHYGLFHLDSDPDCRSDIASGRPEVLEPMKAALDSWIDDHVETSIQAIFPNGEPQG
ncbi:sulfatase-like hydrolase/transferase [Luteolibacter flavescens]|uniref:Sulfatase-like hydrolase/transferase n=1 Tax=Luteolibacter flavescens TaxID=1859460 RepID=A0ABT3FJM4_9BACT|nr:sulfatase-like hydrolase/transferase [Luteolibacter flavescens]MCW1883491.1 sulfatase-like hydrolase/transferase [Luteolibacter flavescens]